MASKRATGGKAKATRRQQSADNSFDDSTSIVHVDETPCDRKEEDDDRDVVFFCGTCNSPVGDSLSWAGSDDDSQIHLTRVTDNVLIGEKRYIREPRQGCRCLVVDLSCKGCQSVLGMVYLSTPKGLDYKRLSFCFHVEQLECYVLGSANQQVVAESPPAQPLTVEHRGVVEQQLLEMKTLVVSMAQRLETIEGGLQVDFDESGADEADEAEIINLS